MAELRSQLRETHHHREENECARWEGCWMSLSLYLLRDDERAASLEVACHHRLFRLFAVKKPGWVTGMSGRTRQSAPRGSGTILRRWLGILLLGSSLASAESTLESSTLLPEALPEPTFPELMQLEPEPGAIELHSTLGSRLPEESVPRLGIELSYAHLPLRMELEPSQSTSWLQFALDGYVFGSMRLTRRLAAGLGVPFRLYQLPGAQWTGANSTQSASGETPAPFGLGDLRVQVQFQVLEALEGQRPGLSIVPGFQFPTGAQTAWVGEGQTHLSLLVASDYRSGPWYLAANVGYRHRPHQAMLGDVEIGSELLVRMGARLSLDASTALRAELVAQLPVASSESLQPEQFPVETLLSVLRPLMTSASAQHTGLWQALSWTAGLGAGIGSGYGTPLLRATFGLHYTPRFSADADRDGILDATDACPAQAEDFDQFQDSDGCPELDNDADNVLDQADRCPLEPEDLDSFADDDGCPDPDNDQDGVIDAQDRCPQALEDPDKTLDEDGCPDPDNDNDLIPDTADACPNQPEDRDYFQDQDGCPELDNDADGIPDVLDQCPDKAETSKSGTTGTDEDGCPDKGGPAVSQPLPGEQFVPVRDGTTSAVTFAKNSARLSPESEQLLHEIAVLLRAQPHMRLRIEAHTDDKGSATHNLKLSQQRADALRDHLVEQEKVAPQQLEALGRGESQPLRDEPTDEARALNRRIEWWVLEPLP